MVGLLLFSKAAMIWYDIQAFAVSECPPYILPKWKLTRKTTINNHKTPTTLGMAGRKGYLRVKECKRDGLEFAKC